MKGLYSREPAMTLAVVQTGLALLLAFGVPLTAEQVGAVLAVSAAVLGWLTRSQVRPVATSLPKPTLGATEVPDGFYSSSD